MKEWRGEEEKWWRNKKIELELLLRCRKFMDDVELWISSGQLTHSAVGLKKRLREAWPLELP